LLSFVGLVMVGVGGFSCEMIKSTLTGIDGSVVFTLGFASGKGIGGCVKYSDTTYSPDAAFQAGNAFAILATLFGVFTVIAAILTTFIRFPPLVVLGMSISAFVVAIFSAIVTGVGFASDNCTAPGNSCKPASMMYVVMVGTFFWIGAGAALLFVRKHEREGVMDDDIKPAPAIPAAAASAIDVEAHNDELPTTVIETITNPDGTKTRTTTATSYKDGQKVVEKTSETI
jgi:hypothetical protein